MTCYNNEKDDRLVEMTLLGNEKAFEELVVRYEKKVIGTAYKVTGNRYSAEDASQDAFVSAWIRLDRLKNGEKFGSWVCSIAKNCARDIVLHYSNTAADISLDLLENTSLIGRCESELLMDLDLSAFAESERDERLYAAVASLSEKIKEAINLHYFEGLTVREISQKLSVPEGTVKWRLSEGRKRLRKEYGVVEKEYNENEALVRRVMRQVEQLKLWLIRDDKTGFEEDYRRVLSNVESLENSSEKEYALADVLMRGYWWIPGTKNDEMLSRIKQKAEMGGNDEVMQEVMACELEKYWGKSRIDNILNIQIPYLEKLGFNKSLGYVYFWLGKEYFDFDISQKDGFEAFEKVLELLKPSDVYYAAALAAIKAEKAVVGAEARHWAIHYTGETIKRIDGRLYLWNQPGCNRGEMNLFNNNVFAFAAYCERLLLDPSMKIGDKVCSSDNSLSLTYVHDNVAVETCAGVFEGCSVFGVEKKNEIYIETAFCPGVGIVSQKSSHLSPEYPGMYEWKLCSYSVKGGNGLVPFAAGNKWSYTCKGDDGVVTSVENVYEVTYSDKNTAVFEHYSVLKLIGYEDTWHGNILKARREYWQYDKEGREILFDVMPALYRAKLLAKTKREKLHTDIATKVMERILNTDPTFNPQYTEKGKWNFFDIHPVNKEASQISISTNAFLISFEWKDLGDMGSEGKKVMYNFLYDILDDAAGCVWSDKWVVGYEYEKDMKIYGMDCHIVFKVLEEEPVTTPAGTFENCRHIFFDLRGMGGGWTYRGGKMHYWFAPGVGIVKFVAQNEAEEYEAEAEWVLTEMKGGGDGYFPIVDGSFRRYEPASIADGWKASVEYTFDEDSDGMVIFRNAYGTRDRINFESKAH